MDKMFKIKDLTGKCGHVVKQASIFMPYAHKKLGFNKPVGVNLVSDIENSKDPYGKTAYYDPNKMEITVFVDKRHVKDILRSLSHELVHHAQCCRGEFDGERETGQGYAQKDPHMRKMEAEAYLLGNGLIFRDFEDSLKKKKGKITMSENKNVVQEQEMVFTALEDLKSWFYNWAKSQKDSAEVRKKSEKEREKQEREKRIANETPQERAKREKEETAAALEKALDDARQREIDQRGSLPASRLEETNMITEELIDEITEKIYSAMSEGEIPAGLKAYQDKQKAKKAKAEEKPEEDSEKDSEEESEESDEKESSDGPQGEAPKGAKPDFLDLDKDGNKTEPMAQAAKQAKNENWHKGNKDSLLYERLMKKWAK